MAVYRQDMLYKDYTSTLCVFDLYVFVIKNNYDFNKLSREVEIALPKSKETWCTCGSIQAMLG